MRKFKAMTLILCMLLSMSMLTGCTMPKIPFLNKDKEEAPAEEAAPQPEVEDTRCTLIGSGTHKQGEAVPVDGIVSIDPSVAANVTSTKFFVNNVESAELPTGEPGDFTAIVVVEFDAQPAWSAEYTYKVEDAGPVSQFPAELQDTVNTKEWETLVLTTEKEKKQCGLTYATTDTLPIGEGDGMTISTGTKTHWEAFALTNGEEETLAQSGVSPLRTSLTSIFVKSMLELFGDLSEIDGGEGTEEMPEEAQQYLQWMMQALDELITVSTKETDMKMYKDDGTSVPVKVATVTYPEGSGLTDVVQCYYVDYGNNCRVIFTYVEEVNPTFVDMSDAAMGENEEEAPEEFKTYEECKEYMATALSQSMGTFVNPTAKANDAMASLCNNIILGNAMDLIPSHESGEPEEESETVEEEEPAEEGEEGELTGAIGDARATYAQRFPDIYDWPENENGDEYSKWIYTIDDSSSFIGSIWLGREGRYFNSEQDVLSDAGGNGTAPGVGSTTPGVGTGTDETTQSASIITRYGTYTFSNGNMKDVTINVDKSTSNIIHMEYDENKYYIESTSASTIQNYMASCIYSTSQFGDNNYKVTESTVTENNIGKLTEYVIEYTDMSGKKKTAGYMIVYNINNDYLVIYGDNLDENNSKMMQILTKTLLK